MCMGGLVAFSSVCVLPYDLGFREGSSEGGIVVGEATASARIPCAQAVIGRESMRPFGEAEEPFFLWVWPMGVRVLSEMTVLPFVRILLNSWRLWD